MAVPFREGQIYGCHNTPAPPSIVRQHFLQKRTLEKGEDIVYTVSNDGFCAMSARRILGVDSLPRVGLFAH